MWTDDQTAQLTALVGAERPVTQETVASAAEALKVTSRSVSSKLRKMGEEVEKVSAKANVFSEEATESLRSFVESNPGQFTTAEIAARFPGNFTARQIGGKLLSMELTSAVKPTPKPESVKTYTDAEEATFIEMAEAGKYLEEIAEKLGKPVNSVRGKALSLSRTHDFGIPKQRDKAPAKVDAFEALGDVSALTVKEIAEKLDKSERGVKAMITRRGLVVADYKAKVSKTEAA